MKAIGNIYLVWRKGRGERRIPVGVIHKSVTKGIQFNYLVEGVEKAKEFGFVSYEGFPDTSKVYTENVIEIFGQRLMRSERNDIKDFYDFWQIDLTHKNNDFYMLAYTQGILPTDNFEFLADFNPVENVSFISEISGLSKNKLSPESVAKGDVLHYETDRENKFDPKNSAVKVFKGKLFLGYIKIIHNGIFYKSKKSLKITVHHIEKNGSLNRVFLKITSK